MDQDQQPDLATWKIWLPVLLSVALAAGILIGMRLQSASPVMVVDAANAMGGAGAGQGKVEELIRYIQAKYVDEVDREELMDAAIDRILEELDPHSNYISAKQLKEVNEQLEGAFDGIGVEFIVLDDTVVVVSPLSGGPAETAGILAGDKIVSVGDSLVAGQIAQNRDIINLLRGERGSEVTIGVLRGRDPSIRKYTLKRDKIPVHSLDIAYMLDSKTGYIKLNKFSATTYEEFMGALEKLDKDGQMEDLVLDLRQNPGGYLQQATNILNQFFSEKQKLLVYTEGRAVGRSDYETTGRALYKIDDVVVLIDEGSASASEIVAGAIQDNARGIIVGRRSFGKGLVQEQYPLRDGSALRLTVARYYTPSGRSIQKPYDDLEAYETDVIHRFQNGELSEESKTEVLDSTKYLTANGNVVYGGGGIYPDFFVPIDSILFNDEYLSLRQHIPSFAYRYAEDHPEIFKSYDLNGFARDFVVSDGLLQTLSAYAAERGVKVPAKALARIKPEIKRFLKARLARQKFGEEGFYTVFNRDDEAVKKALEVLGNPDPMVLLKN
ncbi:MAG TPA: S41 family peptidase [Flavilitoribacter sp.]|nr:S41 family peptidase [Flavilitoribacter sp.]HMQ88703.1 S41 family peptidase [Flavilitoribacter sp.]